MDLLEFSNWWQVSINAISFLNDRLKAKVQKLRKYGIADWVVWKNNIIVQTEKCNPNSTLIKHTRIGFPTGSGHLLTQVVVSVAVIVIYTVTVIYFGVMYWERIIKWIL